MPKSTYKIIGLRIADKTDISLIGTDTIGRITIYMNAPGEASFRFIKLATPLSKIQGAIALYRHENFQDTQSQAFLKSYIDEREPGVTGPLPAVPATTTEVQPETVVKPAPPVEEKPKGPAPTVHDPKTQETIDRIKQAAAGRKTYKSDLPPKGAAKTASKVASKRKSATG